MIEVDTDAELKSVGVEAKTLYEFVIVPTCQVEAKDEFNLQTTVCWLRYDRPLLSELASNLRGKRIPDDRELKFQVAHTLSFLNQLWTQEQITDYYTILDIYGT